MGNADDSRQGGKRNWGQSPFLVAAIVVLAVELLLLGVYCVSIWNFLTDHLTSLEEVRNFVLVVAGVLGLPAGLYQLHNATRRTGIQDSQEKNDRARLEEDRKGALNERFVRAVELLNEGLGAPIPPDVSKEERDRLIVQAPQGSASRLGGIYALERLAYDDPSQTPTIIETLAAFIRQRTSGLKPPEPKGFWAEFVNEDSSNYRRWRCESEASGVDAPASPESDVVAALAALARMWGNVRAWPVDLQAAWPETTEAGEPLHMAKVRTWPDLRGAILFGLEANRLLQYAEADGSERAKTTCARWLTWGSSLYGADFSKSNLRCACFSEAQLAGADFRHSILDYSNFYHADLRDAVFDYARLRCIVASNANSKNAKFYNSNLTCADCEGLDAEGAYFDGASLRGAYLSFTDFFNAQNISENYLRNSIFPLDGPELCPQRVPHNCDLTSTTERIKNRWGDEGGYLGLKRELWAWSDNGEWAVKYLGPRTADHPLGACEPNDGFTDDELKVYGEMAREAREALESAKS